ncbi:MAG TPA: Uma2 family endonuclease [Polyangiaceae bacterium]|nr:Uma2 family endonuclease [Polyangiaceae bacterium]
MFAAHQPLRSRQPTQAVPPPAPGVDQRLILTGISWRDYRVLRDLLDGPGVRMTYLEGALEIMSPSRLHEDVKTRIARLLEVFALERDIPLYGYGSTTFHSEPKERGLEPDECYVIGKPQTDGFPDLAIEVTVTSGGIDKLEVYRGLGVREVWIWEGGRIRVHTLGPNGYEERAGSTVVPDVDIAELAKYVDDPDQHAALKVYREALRSR